MLMLNIKTNIFNVFTRAPAILNRSFSSLPSENFVPIFKKALLHPNSIALKDQNNSSYTYEQLINASKNLSSQISDVCGKKNNNPANVSYLLNNDVTAVSACFACHIGGNVGVPLSSAAPKDLLEYFISDSKSELIISSKEFEEKLKPIADNLKKPLLIIDKEQLTSNSNENSLQEEFLPDSFYQDAPALIIYTSGTTNQPKGVVLTHSNLNAQVTSLATAWKITSDDTILHCLPLNHVHGKINALFLPLSTGAKIVMLPKFDTQSVWRNLLNIGKPQKECVTVFHAVPTIYNYLIQEYEKVLTKDKAMKEFIKNHCSKRVRLMVSGSAPLPQPVFQKWHEITGHKLLERYGMTEIGMALSNPLQENEVRKRTPGFVGSPLPGVQIRIVSEQNEVLLETKGEVKVNGEVEEWSNGETNNKIISKAEISEDVVGSLEVKGPSVFKEYFMKPEETKKEFKDGWFVTGDSVLYEKSSDSFKILGRNSCDIIKSKGYKISALELETKLLENETVQDCAIIGIPDEVLGQKIVAIVKCKSLTEETEKILMKWCENNFTSYSVPSIIKIVEELPRNPMGKVNKANLVKEFSQT